MKKIYLALTAVLICVGFSNAQEPSLNNIWEITESFEYGDKTRIRSAYINFGDNGVIVSSESGHDVGTWLKNESENTLTIECVLFQRIDGVHNIEILNEKELKLKNTQDEIIVLKRMNLPEGKEPPNKYIGEWLLEKAEKDGKTDFLGQLVNFSSNGIFYWQGFMFGKWDYNTATEKIFFDFKEKEDELNGEHTILEINKTSLILDVAGTKLHFSKIDREKIATANKESGITGTWEFNSVPNINAKSILIFKEPDEFMIIETQEGMESRMNGIWVFNKQEMSIDMLGLRDEDTFNGKNKIVAINLETLELENKGKIFKAHKKAENNATTESSAKVNHLTFTEDDFFTEDGEYKYQNEPEKLPWRDLHLLLEPISDIEQLVYSYAKLNEETNKFETKILKANVFVKVENQRMKIDNIFYGYDRHNTPEGVDFHENDDYENYKLYPLNESMYRVLGQEELALNAGTFSCTVVEAHNSNDEQLKIWLINDKPAIIAKVIKESDESNGHYSIYELQEIVND